MKTAIQDTDKRELYNGQVCFADCSDFPDFSDFSDPINKH